MRNIISKWICNIIAILCIAIMTLAFFSLLQSIKDPDSIMTVVGYRPGVIISGSMKPLIQPADMIISKVTDPEDVKIGDIITYRVSGAIPNTHRVVGIIENDGQLMFETKGDANQSKDGEAISSDRLIGRMVMKIPRVGYVVEFLKSRIGFTLVIIVPNVLLWIGVFISVFKSIRKKKDVEKTE